MKFLNYSLRSEAIWILILSLPPIALGLLLMILVGITR